MLCMITQACMMYQWIFWSQNLADPLTIANWACRIPKALSTSFLAAAWALWKSRLFYLPVYSTASQTFASLGKCHPQDSSHSCMYGHCCKLDRWQFTICNLIHERWPIKNCCCHSKIQTFQKKACEIQVSWSATASRIIMEPFFWLWNCPCHVLGQFLTPMHAIYRAKHIWEPVSFVHLQNPCGVFSIRSSQILRTKYLHNSHYESLDTHDGLTLTHGQVVIN